MKKKWIKRNISNLNLLILFLYSLFLSIAIVLPRSHYSLSAIIGLTIIIFGVMFFFYVVLYNNNNLNNNTHIKHLYFKKWLYVLIFVILFLVYFVVLVSNFPGLGQGDSTNIVNQAIGQSSYTQIHRYNGLSNHHPVFYTFMFWIIWKIVSLFGGNVDIAIFTFLLFQIILISLMLTLSLYWSAKYIRSKVYFIVLALAITLNPVIISYSIRLLKDVPFCIIVVTLVLNIFEITKNNKITKKNYIVLFLLMFFMSLLRNTGIYISVFVLVFMFICKTIQRKKCIILLVVCVFSMSILSGPVLNFIGVNKAHFSESMAIPLQQIACTVKNCGNIDDSEKNFINNIMPLDKMSELYEEGSVDRIKHNKYFNDNFFNSNKLEFINLWISLLPKNLSYYFTAWAHETKGYWSPSWAAHLGESESQPIVNNNIKSLIGTRIKPWIITNNPILRFSVENSGLLIWLYLAFLILKKMINKSRWKDFIKNNIWVTPLLAVYIILLISAPTTDQFRYVMPLYLTLPYLPILWKS